MTNGKDYFAAFCKVSAALGTTLEMQEILDLIVTSSIECMNGKAACLFLADEETDVFSAVAGKGLSEDYLHAAPMRARRVVDEILAGGYFSIFDATTDPRLENLEAKKKEGIASILVVPVMVKGKAIGVLSLYTSTHREFSMDEIEFQKALAEQGGMAIERQRLYDSLRSRAKLFFDLASNINSTLDIKQVFHMMTEEIARALKLKGVTVRLVNKDKGTLDLMASYGLSREYLNRGPVTVDDAIGKALNGEPAVIPNTADHPGLQYREETLREGIRSILSVPIKAGDEVIGLLALGSAIEMEFDDDTIMLVQALAQQGGLAIRNASCYLMLQEDKKNLEDEIWTHRCWF